MTEEKSILEALKKLKQEIILQIESEMCSLRHELKTQSTKRHKEEDEWLTSSDVQRRMNWSYATFMRWINGNHPNPKYPMPTKTKKVLGRWFIHTSEIQKLFNL